MRREREELDQQIDISAKYKDIQINRTQRLLMEEQAPVQFEQNDERCAQYIKLAIIKDSRFFMIKALIYRNQELQILRYFSQQLQIIHLQPGKDIQDSELNNIFYPTCVIINRAIFQKYQDLIMKRFYIRHVIIIQELESRTGNKYHPNYQKTIIINPKERYSCLEQEYADNFFIGSSKESQKFTKFLAGIWKNRYKNSKKIFKQQYFKLIGHNKNQRKAFDQKYFRQSQNSNILRIYSQVVQIYQINIILRRFHEEKILSYIEYVVHLLCKSIIENSIRTYMHLKKCYRGAHISQKEALAMQNHLKYYGRQPILCRSFMSCSLDYNTADRFRGNCIFQIHVQQYQVGFASIEKSVYKDEQQILFNVLSKFLIKLVKQDMTRGDKGWHIVLAYVGPSKIDQV